MRVPLKWVVRTGLLVTLAGCVSEESEARARGANDLRCPEEEMKSQEIGGHAYRVKGCGRLATYLCITKGSGEVYCSREPDPSDSEPE